VRGQARDDGVFATEGMRQGVRVGDIAVNEIDRLREVQRSFPVHTGHVHAIGAQQAGDQVANATKAEDKRVCDGHNDISSHRCKRLVALSDLIGLRARIMET